MKLFTSADFSQQDPNTSMLLAAFRNQTGLTANEFPSTLKLMEPHLATNYSLTASTNFVQSGDTNMTTGSGLRGRLSFFDAAVKEVLTKNSNSDGKPLIEFVSEDTNFTNMALSISKKYLGFYDSLEDKYDIIISAFTSVFLDNFDKIFKDFDGTYIGNKGVVHEGIEIEAMIYKILTRAVIHASKALSKHLKNRHEVRPFDGESEEEALDRELSKTLEQLSPADHTFYKQLLKQLRKKIKSKRNAAILETVLQYVLLGFTHTEIGKKLGVTSTRIGDHVWYLKEFMKEVSQDMRLQGDSTLLELIENVYQKKKKR